MTKIKVEIQWHKLEFRDDEHWKDLLPRLRKIGWEEDQWKSCVYVIRTTKYFVIRYPNEKLSPVLYIGRGNLKQRIIKHKVWLNRIRELSGEEALHIYVCAPVGVVPRIGLRAFHQELESDLIAEFKRAFGCRPLHNSYDGAAARPYSFRYDPANAFKKPIGIGQGKSYRWEVVPRWTSGYGFK